MAIRNLCGRSRGSDWTVTNGTLVSGLAGKAYSFAGTGHIGFDQSVIGGYPFTVICYFRTTNSTAAARCIFSQSNSTDATLKLGLRLSSSHFPQAFVGTNVVTGSVAVNDGLLHSIAMKANAAGTVTLYLDGGLIGTVAGGTFPALDRSTLGAVRSTTTTESWIGEIGFPVIAYDRELDAIEIQARLLDPHAWAKLIHPAMLHVPEVVLPQVFRDPIQLGGYRGSTVNTFHSTVRGIEAWLPLNHQLDAVSGGSLVGRIQGVNTAVTHENGGRIGGRCVFNGTTSFIQYPGGDPGLTFASGQPITIFARLTPGTLDRRNIVVFKDSEFSQANYWMALGVTGDGQRLELGYRSTTGPQQLWSNEPVVVFDEEASYAVTGIMGAADSWRMFRNGVEIEGGTSWAFGTGAEAPLTGTGTLLIGQQNSVTRFTGRICDVRIMRTLADDTLMLAMHERPWDAVMRPSLAHLVADKMVSVGVASDFASVFGIEHFKLRLLEQPATSDTGFSIASNREYGIQLIAEVDTAFSAAMWKAMELALNLESDSSLAFTRQKTFSISVTSDSEMALPATVRRLYPLGQPSEGDIAFDFTMTSGYLFGIAGEVDAALDFTMSFGSPLGIASEGNSAQSLMIDKIVPFEMASDLDSAHQVFITRTYTLELAAETTLANDWTVTKVKEIGIASEADFSFLMLPVGVLFLGIDFEALGTHMDASAPRQALDASSTQWSR